MLATTEHVLRTFAWTAFEIMGAAIIFALLPEWSAVVTLIAVTVTVLHHVLASRIAAYLYLVPTLGWSTARNLVAIVGNVAIVRDTVPAAEWHFLVIPLTPTPHVDALTEEHLPLLYELKEAVAFLAELDPSGAFDERLVFFHQVHRRAAISRRRRRAPPLSTLAAPDAQVPHISQHHLHLHVVWGEKVAHYAHRLYPHRHVTLDAAMTMLWGTGDGFDGKTRELFHATDEAGLRGIASERAVRISDGDSGHMWGRFAYFALTAAQACGKVAFHTRQPGWVTYVVKAKVALGRTKMMNEKWPTLEDTEKTRAQLEAEGLDALIVPSFGGESDRRCPPEVCIADPGRVTILEYALAADAKKDRWMPIDRLALEDPATPP